VSRGEARPPSGMIFIDKIEDHRANGRARVSQARGLAELLGLAGVEVDVVEREADGSWTVHVSSAPGRQACCPGCGRAAGRVKERTAHRFKHLVLAPVRVTWHESRLWCESSACQTGGFAETGPVAGAGAAVCAGQDGDGAPGWGLAGGCLAGRRGGRVSWHTAHDAFAGVAAEAGIHLTDTKTGAGAETGTGTGSGTDTDAGAETDARNRHRERDRD
jgi:hypothetical protein